MNGEQFICAARKRARRNGETFTVHADSGKGSHKVGVSRTGRTTIKHGEISWPLKTTMLKQLNWPPDAL